MQRLVYKTRAT